MEGNLSQGAGNMRLKKQGSREHGNRKRIEFREIGRYARFAKGLFLREARTADPLAEANLLDLKRDFMGMQCVKK